MLDSSLPRRGHTDHSLGLRGIGGDNFCSPSNTKDHLKQRHHLSVPAEPVPKGGAWWAADTNAKSNSLSYVQHLMAKLGGNGKVCVTYLPLGWCIRIQDEDLGNSLDQTSGSKNKPVCLHVCFLGRGVGFGHHPNQQQLLASGSA